MTTKVDPGSGEGERIGAYRVVRRLATGGTSDVLLAKAEGPHGFERTVVLKVLLSHFGKDDEVSRMFAREASAYARLSHPAIVRLFDFFAVPAVEGKKGGQLVMVLEYIDGPPLARLKSMVKAIGKELDDKASIYVATCIFSALAAAHSATDDSQIPAPVIHRDVNPSNVLVPWEGYPKLADFGVAKVTGLGHHSVVGMIKGTYGYMAPEQVTGQEQVTPRSDVYAAGIILWELLTRRRAFQRGALPEIEALRAMAEPRLPALESIRSDVDRAVRDALRRALEPRAEKRKITAEEMASILTSVVAPETGRERLMSLLGLVRNDARAANAQASIAPPAMITPGGTATLPELVIPSASKTPALSTSTMHGVAPPATVQGIGLTSVLGSLQNPSRTMSKVSPPRPSSQRMPAASPVNELPLLRPSSSARMPAAAPGPFFPGGPTVPNMPSAAPSEASVRELLSLPTRPAMPAVNPTSTPLVSPPPQPNRIASRPALPSAASVRGGQSEPPPRRPSAAARLAGAVPDDMPKGDSVPPTRQLGGMLDGLVDPFPPGPPGVRLSIPPDSPRVGGPLKDLTGGLGLRDAIDEIMKGVPQSASLAAAKAVATRPPDRSEDPQERGAVLRETRRVPPNVADDLIRGLAEIGHIPPAPAPMQADYPNADDPEDEEASVETVVMEPPPPTPRMAHTMAMEARPLPPAPGSDPKLSTPTPTSTGAMPKYAPPAFGQTAPLPLSPPASGQPHSGQPHSGQPHSGQPHSGGGQLPPHNPATLGAVARMPVLTSDPDSPPSMGTKRGLGVGTIAVLLVVVVAAGVAATVAFVRYQAMKDGPPVVPTTSAPTVAPIVSVTAPVPASAASPLVPASGEPVAVPTAADGGAAVAVPVPTAADAAAGTTEPPPEGMGLVRTAGAAPGRRIFVDDKVAGQTPESISVKCGAHSVKLGSTGKPQDVNVPCGGEIVVGDSKP